jgi:hypothetical protein
MGKSIRNLAAVTRVGLDLAKNAFHVHGVAAKGEIVVVRKLTRGRLVRFFADLPPCMVAMEACSSAHHWARQLMAYRARAGADTLTGFQALSVGSHHLVGALDLSLAFWREFLLPSPSRSSGRDRGRRIGRLSSSARRRCARPCWRAPPRSA